jgi:hypothetical protein
VAFAGGVQPAPVDTLVGPFVVEVDVVPPAPPPSSVPRKSNVHAEAPTMAEKAKPSAHARGRIDPSIQRLYSYDSVVRYSHAIVPARSKAARRSTMSG